MANGTVLPDPPVADDGRSVAAIRPPPGLEPVVPTVRFRDRRRPSTPALLGSAALLLLTAVPLILPPNVVATAIADLCQLVAAVLASVACWRTSRSTTGRMRKSWAAIALGCAAWAIGQGIWTMLDLFYAGQLPFPSAADV